MKQQKEMPVEINSPSQRYRYWFTPPETITIKAADIEPFVPKASWKAPVPADLTLDVPADKVFSKNVPRIPLRLLAELMPDHLESSDGMVKLPVARLAAAYRLVQHREELPPEILPEPEPVILSIPETPASSADAAEPKESNPLPAVEPVSLPVSQAKKHSTFFGPGKTAEAQEPSPATEPAPVSETPSDSAAPGNLQEAAKLPAEQPIPSPVPPPKKPSTFFGFGRKAAAPEPAPSSEPEPSPAAQVSAAPAQRPILPARKFFAAAAAPVLSSPISASPVAEPAVTIPVVPPVKPPVIPLTVPAAATPATKMPEFIDPAPISETPVPPVAKPEAPVPEVLPPPVLPPQVVLPAPTPAADPSSVAASKFPPRRTGSFVGLPIFRRRTPVPVEPPTPDAQPLSETPPEVHTEVKLERTSEIPPVIIADVESGIPSGVDRGPVSGDLPTTEIVASVPDAVLSEPEIPAPVLETLPPISSAPDLPVEEPVRQTPPPPELETAPAMTARILKTEHFPTPSREGQEIIEQEPLQALFLTEETMSVRRVIELCGGLPGINSCVLAHGSVVVASHNVPENVDLVSMSAHAAEMLRAMRDSSARMGVGTVPAVTLHTEKGVISFFNREDLTLLVFHKDRGFIPGVREKMAAVLGELSKARLTLPVSGEDAS